MVQVNQENSTLRQGNFTASMNRKSITNVKLLFRCLKRGFEETFSELCDPSRNDHEDLVLGLSIGLSLTGLCIFAGLGTVYLGIFMKLFN